MSGLVRGEHQASGLGAAAAAGAHQNSGAIRHISTQLRTSASSGRGCSSSSSSSSSGGKVGGAGSAMARAGGWSQPPHPTSHTGQSAHAGGLPPASRAKGSGARVASTCTAYCSATPCTTRRARTNAAAAAHCPHSFQGGRPDLRQGPAPGGCWTVQGGCWAVGGWVLWVQCGQQAGGRGWGNADGTPARPHPPLRTQVRGYLEQGQNRFERPLLRGHWDGELWTDMPDGSAVRLWRKNPPPPEPTRYHLTAYG